MKKLIAVLLLVLPAWLSAQILNGKVYRAGTDSVVAGASVYYNGSLNGTSTNQYGVFYMPAKPGRVPLIVSCIGYTSAVISTYNPGENIKVYLEPKQQQLQDVVVRFDGMTREEKERVFIRNFIGTSDYAYSCTITNLEDVDLAYSKRTKSLRAWCSKPLLIENKMLGYTLTYYLDNFIQSPGRTFYSGNFIFKDNMPAGGNKKIIRNREDAFTGSRMQFVRAAWYNKLKEYGFKLYTSNYRELTADSIVLDSAQQKYIGFKGMMLITHSRNRHLASNISVAGNYTFINSDGFYNTGLRWSGAMSNQRVGDMLPFEYRSKQELKDAGSAVQNNDDDENITAAITRNPEKLPESKSISLFKSMVLVPNNKLDARLVVKKWHQPVSYKIYGTTQNEEYDRTIARNVSRMFERLSELTGLQIYLVSDDAAANLSLFLGDPQCFSSLIPAEARPYLGTKEAGGIYYTTGEQGFTKVIVQAILPGASHSATGWAYVRTLLLKSLGFFNTTDNKQSIFYGGVNYWMPDKEISDADTAIIKTLYQSQVKSGMTEEELNTILKQAKFNN